MCYNSNEVSDHCPSGLDALQLSIWIFNMLEEADDSEDLESSVAEIEVESTSVEIDENFPERDGKYVLPKIFWLNKFKNLPDNITKTNSEPLMKNWIISQRKI